MLIFDHFENERKAVEFAQAVRAKYPKLECHCHAAWWDAYDCDPFPFDLEPPIVHVERSEISGVEDNVMTLVSQFGGTFAGT